VGEAQEQMKKLLLPYTRYNQNAPEVGGFAKEIRLPKFLENVVDAMSKKIEKLGFDTGIRVMYVAKKEAYNLNNRRNIRLIWRQYAKPDCNEFTRVNSTQADAFNTSFFPLSEKQVYLLADRMLHEYRERGFFHLPLRHIINNHTITGLSQLVLKRFFLPYFHPPIFVLNVEELATLWHFPGQILKVPTLERIESKEASPPPNLPV
jgi:hypothetical protein